MTPADGYPPYRSKREFWTLSKTQLGTYLSFDDDSRSYYWGNDPAESVRCETPEGAKSLLKAWMYDPWPNEDTAPVRVVITVEVKL